MRYIVKEKLLTLKDDFFIRDEDGNEVYKVEGKLISIGDKLTIHDTQGNQLARIDQQVIALTPTYHIHRNGEQVATVNKKLLSLFRDRFTVDTSDGQPDIEIEGSILDHNYSMLREGQEVADVSKAWVSLRDSYGVTIAEHEDDVLILACVIVIDMVSHEEDA